MFKNEYFIIFENRYFCMHMHIYQCKIQCSLILVTYVCIYVYIMLNDV